MNAQRPPITNPLFAMTFLKPNPENLKLSKKSYLMLKQAYYNEQILYLMFYRKYEALKHFPTKSSLLSNKSLT